MSETEQLIDIERVRVGLYIRLESWMDQPFLFSSFKIRNEKQLQILRSLGLTHVLYDSAKSDVEPLPHSVEVVPVPVAVPDPELAAMWAAKQARREKLTAQRGALTRCEKRLTTGAQTVKSLLRNLFSRPSESLGQAQGLVLEMVDSILDDQHVALHLMNAKSGDEGGYFHALNVTTLALMLGRKAQLDADALRDLGLGMLLHDMGKEKVPSQVLLKKETWSTAERNCYQQHVAYGIDMAQQLPGLPAAAHEVIAQHHECLDGSGFPARLQGAQIGRFARIACIVNTFDDYCNGINALEPMTPAEALSVMFRKEKGKYDPELLQLFVRSMGVYPPGSLVQLNNGQTGMVMTVNPGQLLQPTILVHDPDVPKEEALWLDMRETPELSIVKNLRPAELSKAVLDYLDPRARISYFAENSRTGS